MHSNAVSNTIYYSRDSNLASIMINDKQRLQI
jgi:hypothetical protein